VARDGDATACGASLISGAAKTYVNGKLVVRLGDGHSHGGSVITASSTVSAEGAGVARIGDLVTCPLPGHGVNPIVGGSPDVCAG
jgi:uncharacterized Zn-binding protein involved in type VI secretion